MNPTRWHERGRKTRLYSIWDNMRSRCSCKASPSYRWYGARGISVCQEWLTSFDKFREWAIASGYADGLQIDRRNEDGPYSPDNCRWATRSQNQQHRRKRGCKCSSRFKGVSWNKRAKMWRVDIAANGIAINGGSFASEVEAANKYDELALRLHGEFAILNDPDKHSVATRTHQRVFDWDAA